MSRLGDELLRKEVLTGLMEAKILVEEYRSHYNHERPHSTLGYCTPAEFGALCDVANVDAEFANELQSATTLS